jgi:hypothetical protein
MSSNPPKIIVPNTGPDTWADIQTGSKSSGSSVDATTGGKEQDQKTGDEGKWEDDGFLRVRVEGSAAEREGGKASVKEGKDGGNKGKDGGDKGSKKG